MFTCLRPHSVANPDLSGRVLKQERRTLQINRPHCRQSDLSLFWLLSAVVSSSARAKFAQIGIVFLLLGAFLVLSLTSPDARGTDFSGLGVQDPPNPPAQLEPQGYESSEKSKVASEPIELVHLHVDPREAPDNRHVVLDTPFAPLEWDRVRNDVYEKEGHLYLDQNGLTLELTLDADLHKRVRRQLSLQSRIAAGVVLLDSRTGAILAIAEEKGKPDSPLYPLKDQVTTARAPAASLMKMVTAAAAVEKSGLRAGDLIYFHGGCQHLRRSNWLKNPARDRLKMSLAQAFGHSCNTAFARLAIYDVGLGGLHEYARRFFLNRPIPSDVILDTSQATLPQMETANAFDVAEAGAGFGFSKLSPVHAALLSAALVNDGVMMAPHLVKRAYNQAGEVVYEASSHELGQVVEPDTARVLHDLMLATVRSGTSRKEFLRRNVRQYRREIGGKTGTLKDMEDRSTLYTWFSGYAPFPHAGEQSISAGALVASPMDWLVRASAVAQESFAQFYYLERLKSRVARGNKPN